MRRVIPYDEIPETLKDQVHDDSIAKLDNEDWQVETRLWPVLQNRSTKRRYVIVSATGARGKAGTACLVQYLRKDGNLGKQAYWIGQNKRESDYELIGGIVMPIAIEPVAARERDTRRERLVLLLVVVGVLVIVIYGILP